MFARIAIAATALVLVASNAEAAKIKPSEMFLAVCGYSKAVKSEKLQAACDAQTAMQKAGIVGDLKFPTAEVKVLYANEASLK